MKKVPKFFERLEKIEDAVQAFCKKKRLKCFPSTFR